MHPENITRIDRITFQFLWNKKWEGKCPDRIQRQVLKNSYEMGGLKAPDMAALNSKGRRDYRMPSKWTISRTS